MAEYKPIWSLLHKKLKSVYLIVKYKYVFGGSEYCIIWRFSKKGHSNGSSFVYQINIDGIDPSWENMVEFLC